MSNDLKAVSVNEIKNSRVSGKVALCSESYIMQRDERELRLLQEIAKLKQPK